MDYFVSRLRSKTRKEYVVTDSLTESTCLSQPTPPTPLLYLLSQLNPSNSPPSPPFLLMISMFAYPLTRKRGLGHSSYINVSRTLVLLHRPPWPIVSCLIHACI